MPKRRPKGLVFVSYAHKDRKRVEPVVNFLAPLFNIFWDPDIEYGENWQQTLLDRIAAARCVMVFWSVTSVKSEFVWAEVNRVKELGIVVPVKLDPRAQIPSDFDMWQYLDLTKWNGQSSKEIERLIKRLSFLVARRRRDGNLLATDTYVVKRSREVTGELRDLSKEIRTISGILIAGNGPVRDLLGTLKEVHRTYAALSEAIERFIAPAIKGKIDIKPYLEMERGGLVRLIKNNRGHCTRIVEYYFRVGGLRDWLKPRLGLNHPEQMIKVDQAFNRLGNADDDLFAALDQVGNVLTEEAGAIASLILAEQEPLARQRILQGRAKLLPLEADLSKAMDELQQIESSLGYVAPVTERKRRKPR